MGLPYIPYQYRKFIKLGAFVIIGILVVILSVYFYSFWQKSKVQKPEIETRPEIVEPGALGAGQIGEMEEGKTLEEINPGAKENPVRPPDTPVAPVIFNTAGTIISIKKDSLEVQGNGSNFEDQKSRVLIIKFTDKTITLGKGGKIRYLSLEGVKYLFSGERILIESPENIRGKTEFIASYVNKL